MFPGFLFCMYFCFIPKHKNKGQAASRLSLGVQKTDAKTAEAWQADKMQQNFCWHTKNVKLLL